MSSQNQTVTQELWITQTQAARLRNTSRQAIQLLIKRGRLVSSGPPKNLVLASQVLNLAKRKPGPKKSVDS